MNRPRILAVASVLLVLVAAISAAVAQQARHNHARVQMNMHPDLAFLHGSPIDPSETWMLSAGGRIYDNWWVALGRPEPKGSHPAYPSSGQYRGADSWRCKECHGWDYKGQDGRYGRGSHATGIKGIQGAQGRDPTEIASLLRASPHSYTPAMIKDDELRRIAMFVSRGQLDVDRYVNAANGEVSVSGLSADKILERGRGIYQAICAACHGFDGRRLNFGTVGKPAYVGTEARDNPWEILHKIVNSHPGAEMINLRVLPTEDAAAVLHYARGLPQK